MVQVDRRSAAALASADVSRAVETPWTVMFQLEHVVIEQYGKSANDQAAHRSCPVMPIRTKGAMASHSACGRPASNRRTGGWTTAPIQLLSRTPIDCSVIRMGGFILLVLAIACAIALAPYIGFVLVLALFVAIGYGVLLVLGRGFMSFDAWYSDSRLNTWLAHGSQRLDARRQREWDKAAAKEAQERASSARRDT